MASDVAVCTEGSMQRVRRLKGRAVMLEIKMGV